MRKIFGFALLLLVFSSVTAELWINSRALLVRHQGNWFFPVLAPLYPGQTFGEDYAWETDYRALQKKWRNLATADFVVLPPIPFGPLTIDLTLPPPSPPDTIHLLGTDSTGRDVLARFIYGFRTAALLGLAYLALTWLIALVIALVCALGPPWLDLALQRLIEVWTIIPFLYIAIAIASLMMMQKYLLVLVLSLFSWPNLSLYLRALILQVKQLEYMVAADLLGLPRWRIAWAHILPSIGPAMLSLIPFQLTAALVVLTSLDFLGFGLPPPEASWGDLLQQALEKPQAWWIAAPVLAGLFVFLTAVTMIGEAIRNKQNPRQTQNYR